MNFTVGDEAHYKQINFLMINRDRTSYQNVIFGKVVAEKKSS